MKSERRNKRGKYRNNPYKDYSGTENVNLAFPSPSLLESYDEISPGLGSKMADLLKNEQKHRHSWENRYLNAMINTARIGQLFGCIIAIIIIYATILMADDKGNNYIAAVICISGFTFLALAALSSIKTRQYFKKPGHYKQSKK